MRCLIAADVDKTVLNQDDAASEDKQFFQTIAPRLMEAASQGAALAFLTGNSVNALATRFLRLLIAELCHRHSLQDLDRFHFFCNSGGVYVHFPVKDPSLAAVLKNSHSKTTIPDRVAFDAITISGDDPKRTGIRPQFIDVDYTERTKIPECEVAKITEVLNQAVVHYMADLKANQARYDREYYLHYISDATGLVPPLVEPRTVLYGSDGDPRTATVQITLKPILSFRQAKEPNEIHGKDPRSLLAKEIEHALDQAGLRRYAARPGGRSSIDVTLEKLDKAYALEFLIDRLNMQGSPRRGEKFGSNAIYIGDEVIVGGGNDYPVTRIPGLLVFAVNSDRELVPCISYVFVPSQVFAGPEATAEILDMFTKCARDPRRTASKSPLQSLKEEIFSKRVEEKIGGLRAGPKMSVDDWQVLHAFVSLMCRHDPASRKWLSILIRELDDIMKHLADTDSNASLRALGSSHEDS